MILLPLTRTKKGVQIYMKKINVVAAVLKNEKGEILCALRSPSMSMSNLWEFPGGKIEQGEIPEDALIREIKEELDCTIRVFELIEEVEHKYPSVIVRLLTYNAKIVAGTPKAKEHAKLEWMSLDALHSLKWAPADLPTVDYLLANFKR
jgi:8-oxo-dGTP diphosphatase